jgi:Protein of unknown function (DUF3126)
MTTAACSNPRKPCQSIEFLETETEGPTLTKEEIAKVERYLKKTFGTPNLTVRERPKKDDSAEVYIGEDFTAVLFREDEDGEVSYQFQMAILDFDLEDV